MSQLITRRSALVAAGTATAALAVRAQTAPAYTLPKLPFAYDALEPYIDAKTMEVHYSKHHQAYVDQLNKALAAAPQWQGRPVDQLLSQLSLLPASLQVAVRNNGGGHWNHSLFWETLGPAKDSKPSGALSDVLSKTIGDQAAVEQKMVAAGLSVFGSGWVWLVMRGDRGVELVTSPNQDNPLLSGRQALMGIDVWEHAYYLKYQNRRAEYLGAILKVIDWQKVSARYTALLG